MYVSLDGFKLDKDAHALFFTAAYLSGHTEENVRVTKSPQPIALAAAALGDPAIASWWRPRPGVTEALFQADLQTPPSTRRARREGARVLGRAVERALRRWRRDHPIASLGDVVRLARNLREGLRSTDPAMSLSRGDVLYGLAGVPDVAAHLEGTSTGFYGALDREEPPLGGRQVDLTSDTIHARRVDIVFHNDDVTHMESVVRVLATALDWPRPRAVSVMARVHLTGHARVASLPIDEARIIEGRLRRAALELAPTLVMSCVAD